LLIALTINNWNNNQLKELEIKYLTEFNNSLEFDLSEILFNIDFNKTRLKSNEIVLQYLKREIDYFDS